MKTTDPPRLYNSRIFQAYLDYLNTAYPDLDPEIILVKSRISKDEVADTAHWFTQAEADLFYEVVAAATGDVQIAKKAGRYSASSKALNLMKQYVLGLMTIETAFLSVAKVFRLFTRGASVAAKKLGPSRVELISRPAEAVAEKPYQCDNRLGSIEAIPKLFTNLYAQVEHPQCLHRGDPVCRYIVSWSNPFSLKLKLIRNYAFLGSLFSLFGLSFVLSPAVLACAAVASLLLVLGLSAVYSHHKSKELERIIESHHHMAEEQITSARIQYDNAALVQKIGQATAVVCTIDDLMNRLVYLLSNRLDFDRGLIMLADESGSRLVYSAGYGYTDDEVRNIRNTTFHLDKPDSKGIFVRSFQDQKPMTVNNLAEIENTLSAKSQKIAHDFRVNALLCVPIIFENRSLGILAVDNVQSKAPLKKSDVNLLQGVASHIAVSINNARLFQRLQESEDKYRQTLESITEGYFETDSAPTVVFMNQALCGLLGYSFDELIRSRFDSHFVPDNQKAFLQLLGRIEKSGEPVRFAHFEMVRKDKTRVNVDLSASLKLDTGGKATGFRGIIRDATERLQLEKERKQLESQLVQSQKMEAIGTLAGGIAHNFNNWLTGILGNISLIRIEGGQNQDIIDRVNKIERIVENAAKMNQQLLGYAKGGKYEVKPMDINAIVRESADTFGAAKKEITMHLELEAELDTVNADRSQIEQVLWNLYVNAMDAMPERGRITIRTQNIRKKTAKGKGQDGAGYICISVSDTGSGINPDDLEKIFNPFFTTKDGKGTGLGLSSVYGIVQAHDGYVEVFTTPGQGTTFELYFPSVPCEQVARPEPRGNNASRGRETILIVDDEDIILDSSGLLLEKFGYRVFTASSGHEALERYKASRDGIDLVIIDMIMPEMSGGELYVELKKLNPDIKALLSSGYSLNEKAQKVIDQGINGFIQKPFNAAQLTHTIQEILAAGFQCPGG